MPCPATVIANRSPFRGPSLPLPVLASGSSSESPQFSSSFGHACNLPGTHHSVLLLLFRDHLIDSAHRRNKGQELGRRPSSPFGYPSLPARSLTALKPSTTSLGGRGNPASIHTPYSLSVFCQDTTKKEAWV
ncbi:hypothetical protein CRG98_022888 [Punica granatum]|uniref:Uncharacterized protein n=1 Tax=Punica granatum TaxID=22663 RepID=A0A2I0JKD6_PUNGR|nr:hypothetical protein CRG98_022888 [Punica granatum]